jgi:two-component system, NarL family, sensor kinase
MIPRMLQLGYGIDNLALLADQLAGRRPRTELGTRAAGGIAWLSVPVESGVITDMPDEAQLLSIFGGHRGQDRHAARGLQQGFARCDVSRGVRFLHRRQPAGRRRVRQIRPTCLPHRRRPRGMKVCVRPEPTEKVVNFCEADSAEDYQTRTTMIRVDADGADMRDIRAQHQLRSVRAAAMLRIAVVGLMVGAMLLGTRVEEWFAQSVLLVCYAAGAIWAAAFAFCLTGPSSTKQTVQIAIAVGDVAAIAIFELLSSGGYTPLAVMALLPLLVALEVSVGRAAIILAVSAAAFTAVVVLDPVMVPDLGWAETIFLCGLFAFLCCTAFAVVSVQQRHVGEIERLSASRRALLADTMSGFESERRQISEDLHDGPLQLVMAARLDISEAAKVSADDRLQRALGSLREVISRIREATFLLHPAVLDQVGLAEAVEKLASITESRSSIDISTVVDYPVKNSIDPMVFAVMRELVSNVERHSRATHARVELRAVAGMCRLDVVDDGVGTSPETLTHRLADGHIGIASHRTRIEAVGGTMRFIETDVGTHVRVEVPLGT